MMPTLTQDVNCTTSSSSDFGNFMSETLATDGEWNITTTASTTSLDGQNTSSTIFTTSLGDWSVSSTASAGNSTSTAGLGLDSAVVISFVIVTIFGLIGNSLIVVVLTKENVKKLPFTPYLMAMAISGE